MPNLDTYNNPGSTSTVTPAGPAPGGPSEIADFYRQLLARQAAQAQQQQREAVRPQAAPQFEAQPSRRQPSYQQPSRDERPTPLSRAEEQDRLQELAYRQRLRQIDLNPQKKFIEGRPGIIGGWADDVTMLPVSMRPGNAAIGYGPQDEARTRQNFNNQTAFDAKLDADRRRTANGNFEY